MKKILLIFLILISIGIKAQVGINTDQPYRSAALDIQSIIDEKNGVKDTIPQGILIPRLTAKQMEKIDTQNDLDAVNSLLVYNLDEDCYNFYSKKENDWISLCSDGGIKASYTFECSEVVVNGIYSQEKALDESNYLTAKLNVTQAGSYTLSATSDNGYYFSTTGEFLTTGNFTVKLLGTGIPVAQQTDNIDIIDQKGNTGCSVSITVLEKTPPLAQYTLNCDDIKDYGLYELGKQLDDSHYLELTVNPTSLGSWQIWTNTVDGISFSGTGTFTTTGSQTIKIQGEGMPFTKEPKEMSILIKSIDANNQEIVSYCSITIRMILPSKLISCIGSDGYLIAMPDQNTTYKYISDLYKSEYNFGLDANSTIKMYAPGYYSSAINPNSTSSFSGITAAKVKTALTTIPTAMKSTHNGPDAFFISYGVGLQDDAAAAAVMEYLEQGGVVVLLSSQVTEKPSYLASKNVVTIGTGNLALMKMLFGEEVTVVPGAYGGSPTWKLPSASKTDLTLNGPFGDVRGKFVSTSNVIFPISGSTISIYGVSGVAYDGIPTNEVDWVIKATDYNNTSDNIIADNRVVAVKAKNYNFIWISDPAIFYYYFDTSLNKYSTSNLEAGTFAPIPLPNGQAQNQSNYLVNGTAISTVNSIFLANILYWAMDQADREGFNAKD